MSQAPIELYTVSNWSEYVCQLIHIQTSDHTHVRTFPIYWTDGTSLPSWLPLGTRPGAPAPTDDASPDRDTAPTMVYQAVMAASAASDPGHLVVACGSLELAVIAAFMAGATGRRFERIGEPALLREVVRREAPESVLLFCGTAQAEHPSLSEPPLEALPPVGLVPARSAAEASLAACKALAADSHPGRGSLHVNCLSASTVPVHVGAAVWMRQQLDPAAVETLTTTDSPWQVLLLDGHGHADRMFLGDAVLRADGANPDFGQLRAGIVLANTCAGAQLSPGGPDAGRRLGQRALAGWPYAYVSTLTVKDNSTIESELFEALLRAGRPLGQAVQAVNAFLREEGIDQPCFVLFGDPMAGLPDHRLPQTAPAEWCARGERDLEAHVSLAGSTPVEIRLPRAPAGARRIVPAPGERPRAVRCAIVPDPGGGAASALLWSRTPSATVRLRLLDGPVRWPLSGLPGRLAELSACGVNLQPVRGPVAQLESEITRMARLASRAGYDLDAAGELDERRRRTDRLLASVQETLVEGCCKRLLSGSLQFTERYRDAFRMAGLARSPLHCACGLRLTRKLLSHHADPRIRRAAHVCPACGVVADGPADLDPAGLLLEAGTSGSADAILLRWRPPRGPSFHVAAGVVGGGPEARRRPWRALPDVVAGRVSGNVELAFHRPDARPAAADGRLVGFALVDLRLLFFARSAPGGGAG